MKIKSDACAVECIGVNWSHHLLLTSRGDNDTDKMDEAVEVYLNVFPQAEWAGLRLVLRQSRLC